MTQMWILNTIQESVWNIEEFSPKHRLSPMTHHICIHNTQEILCMIRNLYNTYGVATMSRILKNIGLFCRIQSDL